MKKRHRLDAKLDACSAAQEGAATSHGGRWGTMRAINLDRIACTQKLSKTRCNVAAQKLCWSAVRPCGFTSAASCQKKREHIDSPAWPFAAMASRFQGVHKQSTGYKMLAALGWKEGEGLVRARISL